MVCFSHFHVFYYLHNHLVNSQSDLPSTCQYEHLLLVVCFRGLAMGPKYKNNTIKLPLYMPKVLNCPTHLQLLTIEDTKYFFSLI
jgi:hypothetical protein